MELIDKDALIESFRETVTHAFEWKERVKDDEITSLCADRAIIDFTEAKLRVESMPTVEADSTLREKALLLLVTWAEECGFGYDNFPEEYETYKDEIEGMGYIDGMIYIAERVVENGTD